MTNKQTCKSCGVSILQTTYGKNNGYCAQCKLIDKIDFQQGNAWYHNFKNYKYWFACCAGLICSSFILYWGVKTLTTGKFCFRDGRVATGSEAQLFGTITLIIGLFCIGSLGFRLVKLINKVKKDNHRLYADARKPAARR